MYQDKRMKQNRRNTYWDEVVAKVFWRLFCNLLAYLGQKLLKSAKFLQNVTN